jgi:hypothetical protein
LAIEPAGYMAGSRVKDATSDALTSKLESKIYYHRDAVVEYVEIKAMVDRVIEEKRKLLDENTEFLNTIDKVVEEKENLQKDHEGLCSFLKFQVLIPILFLRILMCDAGLILWQ